MRPIKEHLYTMVTVNVLVCYIQEYQECRGFANDSVYEHDAVAMTGRT